MDLDAQIRALKHCVDDLLRIEISPGKQNELKEAVKRVNDLASSIHSHTSEHPESETWFRSTKELLSHVQNFITSEKHSDKSIGDSQKEKVQKYNDDFSALVKAIKKGQEQEKNLNLKLPRVEPNSSPVTSVKQIDLPKRKLSTPKTQTKNHEKTNKSNDKLPRKGLSVQLPVSRNVTALVSPRNIKKFEHDPPITDTATKSHTTATKTPTTATKTPTETTTTTSTTTSTTRVTTSAPNPSSPRANSASSPHTSSILHKSKKKSPKSPEGFGVLEIPKKKISVSSKLPKKSRNHSNSISDNVLSRVSEPFSRAKIKKGKFSGRSSLPPGNEKEILERRSLDRQRNTINNDKREKRYSFDTFNQSRFGDDYSTKSELIPPKPTLDDSDHVISSNDSNDNNNKNNKDESSESNSGPPPPTYIPAPPKEIQVVHTTPVKGISAFKRKPKISTKFYSASETFVPPPIYIPKPPSVTTNESCIDSSSDEGNGSLFKHDTVSDYDEVISSINSEAKKKK